MLCAYPRVLAQTSGAVGSAEKMNSDNAVSCFHVILLTEHSNMDGICAGI